MMCHMSLSKTLIYIYIYICIIMLHHPRGARYLYLPSPRAKPKDEVSINVIYTERGWCNKFISWRKPCFKGNCTSKKASSWKVMSCIEDKENTDPHPTKKRKLSLSLKNRDRFKAITDEKLDTMSKPQVPKNTVVLWWALVTELLTRCLFPALVEREFRKSLDKERHRQTRTTITDIEEKPS